MCLFLSLSPSETILTGLEITSWAWPGWPRTSWLRFLTSSCPTWGPGGLNHRQRHLRTHPQGNPSKRRYDELKCGKYGLGGWSPRAEYFHFPTQLYMPCRLGSRWRFSCSGRCVSAGRVPHFSTGKANESLFTSTVKHSSWCLDSFFVLYLVARKTWRPRGESKSSWGIKEVLMLKKNRDEGPFLHWRKNVSRQNKGSLILSWPFCK